jgi:hypothetical protein
MKKADLRSRLLINHVLNHMLGCDEMAKHSNEKTGTHGPSLVGSDLFENWENRRMGLNGSTGSINGSECSSGH